MSPNIPTNATQITLREVINQLELAVSVSEQKVREIDTLLSGSGGLASGIEAEDRPIGICEMAHSILSRMSRMQSSLDTIRGMLAPSQNVAGQALGSLARPMGFADLRDETLRGS